MGIIDGQQQWPPLGHPGHQPVDAVQCGEARRGGIPGLERGTGQPGGTVHQRGTFGRVPQHRCQQIAHDPEAELALQRAGASGKHAQATVGSGGPGGIQQPRLADPGGPLDDENAALACCGRLDPHRDRRQFALPLQQDPTPRCGAGHGTKI